MTTLAFSVHAVIVDPPRHICPLSVIYPCLTTMCGSFVRNDGEIQLNTIPWGQSDYLNVTFSELKNSRWIDLKTRAVFFDFTFCTKPIVGVRARCGYGAHCERMCGLVDVVLTLGMDAVNPNLNVFLVARIVVEFLSDSMAGSFALCS
eukprot:3933617-Rhodomonas_salina.2